MTKIIKKIDNNEKIKRNKNELSFDIINYQNDIENLRVTVNTIDWSKYSYKSSSGIIQTCQLTSNINIEEYIVSDNSESCGEDLNDKEICELVKTKKRK